MNREINCCSFKHFVLASSGFENYLSHLKVNTLSILFILWHDAWRQEKWSQRRRPLLCNSSVNTSPRKWRLTQQCNNEVTQRVSKQRIYKHAPTIIWLLLKTVFSVRSVQSSYKGNNWEIQLVNVQCSWARQGRLRRDDDPVQLREQLAGSSEWRKDISPRSWRNLHC
jgi:hypothetical protein